MFVGFSGVGFDARLCAGVYLSKDLMTIAGHSLKANITTLAPLVLPISEQLLFFLNLVARKVWRTFVDSNLRRKCVWSSACLH